VKTYLVFEPAAGGRDAVTADRVVFLREKFRWMALLFAPLWLLWHRLWLGFLLWLLAVAVLSTIAYGVGLEATTAAPLLWLPTFVVAFEGTELLRRKLLRRGYREAGTIVAGDIEEAERRFFADWNTARGIEPRTPMEIRNSTTAVPVMPAAAGNSVVGLFPEPGGRQ